MQIAVAYAASLVVYLGLDVARAYIAAAMVGQARRALLILDLTSLPPTMVFHLLYIAGLVFFAVVPSLRAGHWFLAPVLGGLFGVGALTVYGFVDGAVLRGWTGRVGTHDIAWAGVASALTAGAAYALTILALGGP